ncbi:hypothetical protein ACP8HI_19260 [Paenibacillus sp. FA6]|uniref:hypothetical protein n=1 Tax=Paenibacillus sp. FA6 TaxID=3413029 RepID=UPI003F65DD57
MGNKKFIIFGLIAVLILFVIFYRAPLKERKEMKSFYSKLGVHLPKDTSILFSESSYGALGDGYHLYIYQLNSKEDMKDLLSQVPLRNWFELPLPTDVSDPLLKNIRGITSPEIASLLPLEATNGYYTMKNNRTNALITSRDVFDFSYHNVFIGIADLENNKIYIFEYNM